MEEKFVFTEEEKHACEALTKEIHEMLNDTLTGTDVERLRTHIHSEIEARHIERDRFGLAQHKKESDEAIDQLREQLDNLRSVVENDCVQRTTRVTLQGGSPADLIGNK